MCTNGFALLLEINANLLFSHFFILPKKKQIPAPNAFTTSSYTGKEYNDIESDQREKGLDSRSRNLSINDFQQLEKDAAHLEAADFDEKFDQKRKALLSSLSDRIHRALAAFVLGGCTDLVLPAFGCVRTAIVCILCCLEFTCLPRSCLSHVAYCIIMCS